jgi:hypothetical protein
MGPAEWGCAPYPHIRLGHLGLRAVELPRVVKNGRDDRNDGQVVPAAAPHRVGHECGHSIAPLWDQVQSCESLRCKRSGPERVRRCLLSSRQTSHCGVECSAARAARSRCWCASAATAGGVTAAVNAAARRAAKRSTPTASAISAVRRGASRMPAGRGGIGNASASNWRGSSHCRHRHRHRHGHRRRRRHQQIVTHQWVPKSPAQAVYWRRSWTWRQPQVAMHGDGLVPGAHESAKALCDVTCRVAACSRGTWHLMTAEEHRMDSHPDNAACSELREAR